MRYWHRNTVIAIIRVGIEPCRETSESPKGYRDLSATSYGSRE